MKLVEGGANSPLLQRIAGIRRQMAADLGYLLPPVRVTDNLVAPGAGVRHLLKGVEIARYEMPQGCELAIHDRARATAPLKEQPLANPPSALPAVWVHAEGVDKARAAGYTVVDCVSVMGTHLVRNHPPPRARIVLASGRQEACSIAWPRRTQGSSRIWFRNCSPCRGAEGFAEFIARASFDSGRGLHFGSARRSGGRDEEPGAADRVRAAGDPAHGREAIFEPEGDLPAYFLDARVGASDRIRRSSMRRIRAISNCAPTNTRDSGPPRTRAGRARHTGGRRRGIRVEAFRRQIIEGSLPNVAVLSHNEVPAGAKVISLGVIQ